MNVTVPLEILEQLRQSRDFRVQWSVLATRRWQEAHPDDSNRLVPDALVEYDLTPLERKVLWHGLLEWGGPARCTEELAIAMGFASVTDLFHEGDRIRADLEAARPMKHVDWARTLLATEIVFISGTVGAAVDWEIDTGLTDQETFITIRGLQSHLVVSPLIGEAFGTRYRPRAN